MIYSLQGNNIYCYPEKYTFTSEYEYKTFLEKKERLAVFRDKGDYGIIIYLTIVSNNIATIAEYE